MATYTYTKTVDSDKLSSEIVASSVITKKLASITTSGTTVYIDFNGTLTTAEETELDTIVSNHVAETVVPKTASAINVPGVIIPLYVYPSDIYNNTTFNTLIDLKKKYHLIPVYVIINPSSGPGDSRDGNYTVAIERLHGAGIKVVGYVDTNYATETSADVKEDIEQWRLLYPDIDGFMLDRMTTADNSTYISYYEDLHNYIHVLGLTSIVNPGAVPNYKYFDRTVGDIFIIHNSGSYPTEATLKGDSANGLASYSYENRAAIVYNQASMDYTNYALLKKYLGYLYITDDNIPNAFDSLSTHVEELLRMGVPGPEQQMESGPVVVTEYSDDTDLSDGSDTALVTESAIKTYISKQPRLEDKTGILIPLYVYPSSIYTNTTYNTLIDLKKNYHDVPMYVVLNPASGPGTVTDGNYTVAIKRLQGAGCIVLGYIATNYGATALSTVTGHVDTWLSLYPGIDGIFVDEVVSSPTSGQITYYTSLNEHIHGKALYPNVLNTGTAVNASVYDLGDIINVYEGTSYPSEATLKGDFAGGAADFDYSRRGALAYNQSSFNEEYLRIMTKYSGLVYITDVNGWTGLSGYTEEMLRYLSDKGKAEQDNSRGWTQFEGSFTRSSDSQFTVTDNAVSQEIFKEGRPIRFKDLTGTTWYYAIVTAYSSGTVTIGGAPFGSTVSAIIEYGGTEKVYQYTWFISSTFADAWDNALLANDENRYEKWSLGDAACVMVSHRVKTADTGATQPSANLRIAGNTVCSANSFNGRKVATSWVDTVVDIGTSNYLISYGDDIEVFSDGSGTNNDASDLTIKGIFVLV